MQRSYNKVHSARCAQGAKAGSQPIASFRRCFVSPEKPAAFSFSSAALHVPQKVEWSPYSAKYEPRLRGPKAKSKDRFNDLAGRPLTVKADLTGKEFKAAKEDAFLRACAAWDARDESKRTRLSDSGIAPAG